MSKRYNDIVHDEVLFWFDILEDNSLRSISEVTGIHMDKVRKIINQRYP